MAPLNILIIGGGIAGPVAAYWLARGGHQVTVIERASSLLKTGQGIDVEGPAREIINKMGLIEQMKAKSTREQGFALTDDEGKTIAAIPGGLTQEIEIMRGDMCEILCKAADAFENVTFRYETRVVDMSQTSTEVQVTFHDGEKAAFDAIIGADGMRSKTRDLAFDEQTKALAFRHRDHYCAYFSIPREEADSPNSRWQHATRGRTILVRPHNQTLSSAYLTQMDDSARLAAACHAASKDEQKRAVAHAFEDVGGLAPRVVAGMLASDNFYFDSMSQIKLDQWSTGRVALIGDAAYAPSGVTGQGVILSVLGAYVVAGEVCENPHDPPAAFRAYEARLRAQVEKSQYLGPFGGSAPRIVNPQSRWGIWAVRAAFRLVAWSGAWKLFSAKGAVVPVPEYPSLHGDDGAARRAARRISWEKSPSCGGTGDVQ